MQKILKDPLTHFLALGLLMFVVYRIANPVTGASDDPKSVVVDEAVLLTFIQYRTKTFEPKVAKARLKALPADKLQLLIDDYVREEVLYREALSLGLEANDYIIKRRLIQKLDFISQGFAEAATKLSDQDVIAYYEANKQNYYEQPFVTFTHVFFDNEKHGAENTTALAQDALQALNAGSVPFSDAPKHGDRFPFHVNYVERTPDFVASHFGAEMATAVFALAPSSDTWHGPYTSPYGAHLVMLIKRQDERTPELDEVKARVLEDARRIRLKELADTAIQAIIDTYSVRVEYGTGGAGMRWVVRLVVLAALTWPALLHAHESRPLNIQISQKASDTFILRWQVPPSVPAGNRPDVKIKGGCRAEGSGRISGLTGARLYRCASGLGASSVEIGYPDYNPSVSALIRLTLLSGEKHTALLSPEEGSWPVPNEETTASIAWQYLKLGIEHILAGYDHLLFLACLLFIAGTWRRIAIVVTGFTIAHSITLALAALNIVRIPVPPVEATIALSIVFLAVEIARNRPDTLTMRYPIAVSSSFGLLHGFGFASVLNEIGLPQTEIPAALLFFNLGVEVGQLIFAAVVIVLWVGLARAIKRYRMAALSQNWARNSAVYCVGGLAAFWVVERIAGFWV